MTSSGKINTGLYRGRVAAALSAWVGPDTGGLHWTDTALGERTGQDPRTVKAHRLGETPPCGQTLLTYCAVLGPEFANTVLGMAGLTGCRRVEPGSKACKVLTSYAQTTSELAEALEDGRIDHQERRSLIASFHKSGALALGFVADLEMEEAKHGR